MFFIFAVLIVLFLEKKMRYLVFLASFMFLCIPAQAQIYKWIDENGKTQYSDQPPLSAKVQKEQRLRIHSALAAVSLSDDEEEDANKPRTLADERADYDQRRQERMEKEAEKKAKVAENKQKCVDAQSRLRVFLESPRLRMPDGQGGLSYVDDNVRDQKIKEANEAIAEYCT